MVTVSRVVSCTTGTIIVLLWILPLLDLLSAATVQMPNMAEISLNLKDSQAIEFYRSIHRQAILTLFGTLWMTFIVVLGAYGLSLLRGASAIIARAFFVAPIVLDGGLIPTYIVVRSLKLVDTPLVLLLAERVDVLLILVGGAALASRYSHSLREAAAVDGAGPWRSMLKVVLPAHPQLIVAVMTLSAIRYWNSWFPAFLFVHRSDLRPAQNFLRSIATSAHTTQAGEAMRDMATHGEARVALYALSLLLPGLLIVRALRAIGQSSIDTKLRRR